MPKVVDAVESLLEQNEIDCPPVPVRRIAKSLGIELKYQPYDDADGNVSGMLFREKGRAVIGINKNDVRTRQCFTIAHEVGHFLLHDKPMFLDRASNVFLRNELSGQAIDPQEIQANNFAAELLMPSKMVRAEFQDQFKNLVDGIGSVPAEELIERLAATFEVSGQAMTFRLANLGLVKLS